MISCLDVPWQLSLRTHANLSSMLNGRGTPLQRSCASLTHKAVPSSCSPLAKFCPNQPPRLCLTGGHDIKVHLRGKKVCRQGSQLGPGRSVFEADRPRSCYLPRSVFDYADLHKETLEAYCSSAITTGLLVLFPRCLLHVVEVHNAYCVTIRSTILPNPSIGYPA